MGESFDFDFSDFIDDDPEKISNEWGYLDTSEIDFETFLEQLQNHEHVLPGYGFEDNLETHPSQTRSQVPGKRQRHESHANSDLLPKRFRALSPLDELEVVSGIDETPRSSVDGRSRSVPENHSDVFTPSYARGPWEEHFWEMLEKVPNEFIEDDEQYGLMGIKDEPWYLYDPEIFTLLGAESETDGNKHSEPLTDQEIICYGMIHKARVRILPQAPELLKRIPTSHTTLETIEKQNIYVFNIRREGNSEKYLLHPQKTTDDMMQPFDHVGVLNRQSSSILAQIPSSCTFEAYVSAASWVSSISRGITIDKDICIEVDMIVYGPRKTCQEAGDILQLRGVHLQEPDYYDLPLAYENPHFIDLSAIQGDLSPGLDPLDSSLFHPNFQELQISNERTLTEAHMKQKVATAFKSTTRSQNLRRLAAPMGIRTTLLPYQEEALDFIMQRESGPIPAEYCLWRSKDSITYTHCITGEERTELPMEIGGGLLADEMGLGKTLTMLSAISRTLDEAKNFANNYRGSYHTAEQGLVASRATLVVVPSPLLLNEWLQEIKLHCTEFQNTIVYHGHGRQGNPKTLANSDIVLSTYHTIASESLDETSPLWRINWYRIVLDEAHIIRRTTTKLFKSIKRLRATLRWCLTGTPIQNSLEDLAALVNFIGASPLDDIHAFKDHIITPLMRKQKEGLDNLRLLLDSICLRRTQELLNLAEVIYDPQVLEFSAKERKQYTETRERLVMQIKQNRLQPHQKGYLGVFQLQLQLRRLCNHGTFQKSSLGIEEVDLEQAITELKKQKHAKCGACKTSITGAQSIAENRKGSLTACGHLLCFKCVPGLMQALLPVDGREGCLKCSLCGEIVIGEYLLTEDVTTLSCKSGQKRLSASQYFNNDGCSTKVSAVVADIEKHQTEERKSIVFSCWTRSLDLIGSFLDSRKIPFVRIDGSHTLGQRKNILENYQNCPEIKILLMTTGTGAVGLNLTAANCVHILEPQWNPMIETQAIARVNRLGQTRNVRVVRYIIKGTVEELELQSQQLRKLRDAKVGWEVDDGE
ncbi:uncharacterized protein PAC_06274 [Phialocephala subalpina]|uniref:Helicase-like transcription factor protein n=1 Tax=Phialocephala subalpina TaxID=576137 RepID=A0A1L7WUE2_9HELO|nr:uncharacterized protein PAC_06274 [Phialocephala subalpina]